MPVSLMFLALTDAAGTTVSGDSEDGDYAGQIEIDNFKWDLEEASIGRAGSGGTAPSRVIPGLLVFNKGPDLSTPRLLKAVASGEICQQAVFTLTERSSLEPFHLVVTLTDVRLTGYELDATDEEASVALEESWTMTYKNIKFHYTYEGTHEVLLERPPGADDVEDSGRTGGGGRPGVELADRFKDLSRSDQARFLEMAQLQSTSAQRGAPKSK